MSMRQRPETQEMLPAGVTGRIAFADQLRGLAALCVAYSHLVGVFWAVPDLVSGLTGAPVQPGDIGRFAPWIVTPWFNGGPFGVGLFFLISGLVIPLSLGPHGRGRFLLARALRIYPVYLAAMALEVAALMASRAWWGRPVWIDPATLWGNALLIANYAGLPAFDMVNWTLCIEVKFYLLMALLAAPVLRGSVRVLAITALALAAASMAAAWAWPPGGPALVPVGVESSYLIYMLCGVLFSFHLRGQLGPGRLAGGVGALTGLFLLSWYGGGAAGRYGFQYNTVNYLYALALFAALYGLRHRVRPFWLLDAMARVSYPFYLIHALVGFTLLRLLTAGFGLDYGRALAGTLALLLLLASLLHLGLERWTIRAGHCLRRRPAAVGTRPQERVPTPG